MSLSLFHADDVDVGVCAYVHTRESSRNFGSGSNNVNQS